MKVLSNSSLESLKYQKISCSCLRKFRMVTSLDDVKSLRFWRANVAEFLGSALLVFMGCGSCTQWSKETTPSLIEVSFGFSFTVVTLVWIFGQTSGAHFNPSVTLALMLTRKISFVRAVFYMIFQSVGGITGAALLLSVLPKNKTADLCPTVLAEDVSVFQGVLVESFLAFFLVMTVYATSDTRRTDHKGSFPLTIGIVIMACILMGAKFTGASINPVRSLGPAVVGGVWEHHWIYWLGPISGGILGGILYDNLFAVNASLMKAKACFLTSDYNGERFHPQKVKIRIMEEESIFRAPLAEPEELYMS
ncbi:aquaporin AQPAe.a [Octopus bimaculoides]|uniref:Aquaporin n=1 Tax=Octopus bimaculoides TaxID=37653 RepID=A0A0L8I672_OCTBM|nr:aquaporin AQPAe.a [Octopus bimaculoides]|eukprot:XP_014790484.1 PREDICTED: aquaporin AQPAe.a-like [Octopus bimaculoides]